MNEAPCFIGIDVATAQLDIAVRPSGVRRWSVWRRAIVTVEPCGAGG